MREFSATGRVIETHYLGATDRRCSRIVARAVGCGSRLVMSYGVAEDEAGRDGGPAHAVVARALAEQQGWPGHYYAGATSKGYAFIYAGENRGFGNCLVVTS